MERNAENKRHEVSCVRARVRRKYTPRPRDNVLLFNQEADLGGRRRWKINVYAIEVE